MQKPGQQASFPGSVLKRMARKKRFHNAVPKSERERERVRGGNSNNVFFLSDSNTTAGEVFIKKLKGPCRKVSWQYPELFVLLAVESFTV